MRAFKDFLFISPLYSPFKIKNGKETLTPPFALSLSYKFHLFVETRVANWGVSFPKRIIFGDFKPFGDFCFEPRKMNSNLSDNSIPKYLCSSWVWGEFFEI